MSVNQLNEEDIFNVARKIDVAELRSEYLEQVCGHNTALRERVRVLLDAQDEEASFLESPPNGLDATVDGGPIAEGPGTLIGKYKLMEQIGEGGMGIVYVAEQQRPMHRKVALKIIKPGMDTKEVIARFEAERQALAMMDHPNIARVLDAGTTESGRPYFVMELVRGIPITEYFDRKRFGTEARLELFVTVCQAIQHAHQKGVIHRDVKPSNVLVTEHDGTPMCKVIDFGVAKAINQRLTERTIYTRHQQLVGTPLYMSPEQAELSALDVDTRTDIYSLGVLLYELLTGVTPFDRRRLHEAAFDEMRRIIREEEPPKPSLRISTLGESAATVSELRNSGPKKLSHALRGELDWIVMKALEKDRTRRYETALGLGRDVQRYLNQEAVHACPPSVGYHLRKLVRRHKAAVAFGTSVIVLLSAGIVGTWSGWRAERSRAREARDAQQQETELRGIADRQREAAEYGRYVMQIQAAEANLELDNYLAAQAALADTSPAFRNWEWRHLAQSAWAPPAVVKPSERLVRRPESSAAEYWASAPAEAIIPFQPDRIWVEAMSISHDGEQVATTLGDGSLRIWDVRTGDEDWISPAIGAVNTCVTFSRDGSRLACGDTSGEIWVWDLPKQEPWRQSSVNGSTAGDMWFSPDGSRLVVAYFDGQVAVWDVETHRLVTTPFQEHSKSVWSVQFQDHGEAGMSVYSASVDGSVRVWDTETGEETKEPQSAPPHEGLEMMAQAISPDLHTVAAGYHDGTVILWDLRSDTVRNLDGAKGWIEDLIFSADGSCLFVVEGQRQISVFDVNTLRMVNELKAETSRLRKVALSPRGDRVATAGWDAKCNIWAPVRRLTEQRPTLINAHDDVVLQAAFNSSGNQFATASYDKTVKVWDTFSRELIKTFQHDHEVLAAAFSPDGRLVAGVSSRGDVRVWDLKTEQEVHHAAGNEGFLASAISNRALRSGIIDFSAVFSASPFAHGSDKMVVNGPHGMVVLDSRTGVERVPFDYEDLEYGDRLPAGWAVISPQSVPDAEGTLRRPVAVITDGRIALGKGPAPPVVHVWGLDTGERLFSLAGHKGHPFWVKFSPDGSRMVTSAMDKTAIIWDAKTGKELHKMDGHRDSIVIACFSPDGKRLATAADDEAIVWDVATGRRLSTYYAPYRPLGNIEFSPDGTRVLATFQTCDAACVWDPRGPQARQLVRLVGEGRLLYGTWSPDGHRILTCWDDGSVRLFEAVTWDIVETHALSIEDRVLEWHRDRASD